MHRMTRIERYHSGRELYDRVCKQIDRRERERLARFDGILATVGAVIIVGIIVAGLLIIY